MKQSNFAIKKIAVLGAGVMGAQIAAHCVNAGFQTLLYDLSGDKPNARSELAEKAIQHLQKLAPAPLANPNLSSGIIPCNYDEDLDLLSSCSFIIEAIGERFDWKKSLYEKITPFISEGAILASNTSGLSVNALSDLLPDSLKNRFCGVHFFNPPRYMHLVELIPSQHTDKKLLDNLETWLTSSMGKGVVRAKDTPNFIANRMGVFSLLATMHHAEAFRLGFDEVDAITGALIGRPKSATFRTMDVVGLDTMAHVVQTMTDGLPEDPWHSWFVLPNWMQSLIKMGALGQKTGFGIYRKQGSNIEVWDVGIQAYRTANTVVSPELIKILEIKDKKEQFLALSESKDVQAQFLMACYLDVFSYAAFHLSDIADNVAEIDRAMRYGFGWSKGPFELWETFGVSTVTNLLKRYDEESKISFEYPFWLESTQSFYQDGKAFNPKEKSYQTIDTLPVYQKQQTAKFLKNIVFKNEGVELAVTENNIGILSFLSKANAINEAVIEGLEHALDYAESSCKGLIIYQKNPQQFSGGADLMMVANLIKKNAFSELFSLIKQFQDTVMRMQYSSIPVVAALRGRAFGGGCELLLHTAGTVAAFESYPGLVEVGVGLLPAGGGCKEMAKRAAFNAKDTDIMAFLVPEFRKIATAYVATSAVDAKVCNYLKPSDWICMNTEEVLYNAIQYTEFLSARYQTPLVLPFAAAGVDGAARLKAFLVNAYEGHMMTEYDYEITSIVADVICGGDVYAGTMVDDAWMLKLEREAFVRLAEDPRTKARIDHLLTQGKPLRN